jgi:hypothetical protein
MNKPFHMYYNWHYSLLHPWKILYDFWAQIQCFLQRGWRGYAISDTWSLGDYLNSWMPEAIRDLKERAIGYPCFMLEKAGCKDWMHPTKEDGEKAEIMWRDLQEKMARGFEATRIIEDEVLYPNPDNPEMAARYRALREEADEGMKLFAEHYMALWD